MPKTNALTAARKKWGEDCQLRENKGAPTAKRREELERTAAAWTAELDQLRAHRKQYVRKVHVEALRATARVAFNDPSEENLQQVASQLTILDDIDELEQDIAAARKAADRARSIARRRRYSIVQPQRIGRGFAIDLVHCEADTLTKLARAVKDE